MKAGRFCCWPACVLVALGTMTYETHCYCHPYSSLGGEIFVNKVLQEHGLVIRCSCCDRERTPRVEVGDVTVPTQSVVAII